MELQEWANKYEPKDEMIYKAGYWDQIIFIRDTIPGIFSNGSDEYLSIQDSICVISNHMSKSITLPVVQIPLPIGIKMILRYNFHDWKVSIDSPFDIIGNFAKLFNPSEQINPIYCEGFKAEWVFAPYDKSKSKFTVELYPGEYYLFTFLWVMANQQVDLAPNIGASHL